MSKGFSKFINKLSELLIDCKFAKSNLEPEDDIEFKMNRFIQFDRAIGTSGAKIYYDNNDLVIVTSQGGIRLIGYSNGFRIAGDIVYLNSMHLNTVGNITYATPRVKYLTIPASAFLADNNSSMIIYLGNKIHNTVIAIMYYYCPVYLPDASVITEMQSRMYNVGTGSEIGISLVRTSLSDDLSDSIATNNNETILGMQTVTDDTISNGIVNNSLYRYYIVLCLNPKAAIDNSCLYYSRIKYTIASM